MEAHAVEDQASGPHIPGPVGGLAQELSRSDTFHDAWREASAEDSTRREWPLFLGELGLFEDIEEELGLFEDIEETKVEETAGVFGAAMELLLSAEVVKPACMRCSTCNSDRPYGTFGFHLQQGLPAHLRCKICDACDRWYRRTAKAFLKKRHSSGGTNGKPTRKECITSVSAAVRMLSLMKLGVCYSPKPWTPKLVQAFHDEMRRQINAVGMRLSMDLPSKVNLGPPQSGAAPLAPFTLLFVRMEESRESYVAHMSNPGDVTCVQLPPGRYFLQWFLAPVASAAPPAGGPRKTTRVIAGRIVRKGKQRFLPVTACARSVGPAGVRAHSPGTGDPMQKLVACNVVKAKRAVVPPSLLGHAVCVGCAPGQWLLGTLGSLDVVENGNPLCVQALAGSPGDTRQLRSGPHGLASVVRTVVVQAVMRPRR